MTIRKIFDEITTYIGFDNLADFTHTLFFIKQKIVLLFAFLFGASFTTYFWQSTEQFIFLWVMLMMDLLTGIMAAIKKKEFSSRRLPRFIGVSYTYSVLLFLAFNLSKYSPMFFIWLPSTLYFMFNAVLFTSIIENFNKLGWLDTSLYTMIKDKLKNLISKKVDDKKE